MIIRSAAWRWTAWSAAILLSTLASVSIVSDGADAPPSPAEFRRFERIYEPSAVQQLPDGRIIVLEDERSQAIDILTLDADGEFTEKVLRRPTALSWAFGDGAVHALEDLEAVDVDEQGFVYAITSHSRRENGKRRSQREHLVRFRLDGERVTDFAKIGDLRKHIWAQHEFLKRSAKVRDVKDEGGFNIEGLSLDASRERLLIGLRGPLHDGKAIIATLENPQGVFESGEEPRIAADLILLPLKGGGIRAIAYVPRLSGYLVISQRPSMKRNKAFKLWFWNGQPSHRPQRVRVDGVKELRRAEGVTPVTAEGFEGILIVSDDGEGVKRKPGHYLLASYDQLVVEKDAPNTGAGQ